VPPSTPGVSTLEYRERFSALAMGPDEAFDLLTGALLIAGEDTGDVDLPDATAKLEGLADAVRPGLAGAASDHDLVARLNRELFDEQRFRGNSDDYYDPRNSYLNVVLERRLGIPITLCIVYVEVARRLGVDAHGVGFPGHFLARIDGGGEAIFVDAFRGQILTRADCEQQLRDQFGPAAEIQPELLAPTAPRHILARMLGNLKQIYLQRRQLESALACCDRTLLLLPDAIGELRDRGLVYRALECFGPAADDLERFLTLAPANGDTEKIAAIVQELRQRTSQLQ
jgi:regulator of sirC expression with transglutaminase-like and TPR domain